MRKPRGAELLAPAGNFQTALAAFAAGADAVYCGLSDFSARAFAENLTLGDLKKLVAYARANGRKVYVTFNTVVDEDCFDEAVERLAALEEAGPDAIIVQDIGVARICRRYFPGLALHASTQLVAHNLEGVLALGELGFTRVVLARELSLEEISSVAKRCGKIELEVFIHGALCYSLSGLCLFGAMEKGRSGNRGKCPYCCRQGMEVESVGVGVGVGVGGGVGGQGNALYPFSMKDLRLGEDVRKLVDAGVASLKIEGRMKSELYVASVTKYYRDILGTGDEDRGPGIGGSVTVADLETVFSRRTTKLYFDGRPTASSSVPGSASPVDSESLGHLGAEIGVVKRVTKDREGQDWLRFHTARALEKHDGLQFEAMSEGKHLGMGVSLMREAISRHPVFEVAAGADVEILLTPELAAALKPGMKIYCSMSNAVKRMFPSPAYRPSDYPGCTAVDVEVALRADGVTANDVTIPAKLGPAKNPEKTFAAVEKAFSKLGDTGYRLGKLVLDDPDRLFAPMSVLNDLRRDLVERLDDSRAKARRAKVAAALDDDGPPSETDAASPRKTVKLRPDQPLPAGGWDEVVVAINTETPLDGLSRLAPAIQTPSGSGTDIRLALPVYTSEIGFNRLRSAVKRLLRAGYARWEASDLATLRMLRTLGVTDITADWTLYAFNLSALRALAVLGVRRFVASPENNLENRRFLAESGHPVEFIVQQSTPLFISLTEPRSRPTDLAVFRRDGLWVTTKKAPRTFDAPPGVSTRIDLSWDPS